MSLYIQLHDGEIVFAVVELRGKDKVERFKTAVHEELGSSDVEFITDIAKVLYEFIENPHGSHQVIFRYEGYHTSTIYFERVFVY